MGIAGCCKVFHGGLPSALLLLVLHGLGISVALGESPGWPVYRGDPAATQYSSLDQIHADNVSGLEVAWIYRTGDAGGKTTIQCNPILHHGLLFITSPQLAVIALEADTGSEVWRYKPDGRNTIAGVNRGVAFWENAGDARILFTAGHELIALDAFTGKPVPGFGNAGRVDLREHLDHPVNRLSLSVTSPGIIHENLIILGSSTGEGYQAAPGHVRAYDVRSGELAWVFRTIPREGEPGHDTWDWWEGEWYGGTNVWGGLSLDVERGWVFLATGSPTYDFYGANRAGENLFGNCVVALDAGTGQYIWHYQVIHHDLWDFDLPCAPSLTRIFIDGDARDVVAQPTKMGFLVLLDRETGEPVYPMEEVSMPPSDIPGEMAWPSQPVPRTGFYTRQTLHESDLRSFSTGTGEDPLAEHRKYRHWGRYTPPSIEGSLAMPGTWGGGLWGGASVDPRTGTLFVSANELASVNRLRPVEIQDEVAVLDDQPGAEISPSLAVGRSLFALNCVPCHGTDLNGIPPAYPGLLGVGDRLSDVEIARQIRFGKGAMPAYRQFSDRQVQSLVEFIKTGEPLEAAELNTGKDLRFITAGYQKFIDKKGYPFSAPPWGSLNALDLATGELKWKVPLGEIEELTAMGIPPTGDRNFGGCISTAGDLVFIAASTDEKIRAFHSETGEERWQAKLPAAGYATPATYMINGKQFLVIAAGGGGRGGTPASDAYVAFALPDSWSADGRKKVRPGNTD